MKGNDDTYDDYCDDTYAIKSSDDYIYKTCHDYDYPLSERYSCNVETIYSRVFYICVPNSNPLLTFTPNFGVAQICPSAVK